MELFASRPSVDKSVKCPTPVKKEGQNEEKDSLSEKEQEKSEKDEEEEEEEEEEEDSKEEKITETKQAASFEELGLCSWVCQATVSVGYRRPTPIQSACISAILQGRDVLACAETGSGKTAAFVLPMLHILSQDPYGVFGVILTPTRELAIQIGEQIAALGSAMAVTYCLTIGGMNLIDQGMQLSRHPHFIVATPGRLRHHLQSADPPHISRARFLVMDEADRLLAAGFSRDLEIILNAMGPRRQTLLFSATLTNTLEELEGLALKDALRFDLTRERRLPTSLRQEYLFMPSKLKICFLVATLQKFLGLHQEGGDSDVDDELGDAGITDGGERKHRSGNKHAPKRKRKKFQFKKKDKDGLETLEAILAKAGAKEERDQSESLVIIFVESVHRCHELSATLKALNIGCVALHSMLPQNARLSALAKFKSMTERILVATDVASRGLDIPSVDMVINFDLPRVAADYVHRVGRTARAGRGGQSIAFVTQHDIELLHALEEEVSSKLVPYEAVKNEDVAPLLNPVSKAMQTVRLDILSSDFGDKEATFKARKRAQREALENRQKRRAIDADA